jgi:hypothetical protein
MPPLDLCRQNLKVARVRWGLKRGHVALQVLEMYSNQYKFSLPMGDLLFLDQSWYVTHVGLIRLSRRRRCYGIDVHPVVELCDTSQNRYAFCATVYTTRDSMGFTGYGDADPSNVSPLVHGAEMRIAETRSVNRALRKAYGIGFCSAEEIGSFPGPSALAQSSKKIPPQPVNGNSHPAGSRVRDRLCQIIREHNLDPGLVKSYAIACCGTKSLRDATREQVENFVVHLADWAEKDRNALLCQLNSFMGKKEGAA